MNYFELTSIGNLFQAYSEFKKGKKNRLDLQVFERNLEDNLFELNQQLKSKTYRHGKYESFYVQDPKQRHIHKAEVKDRIVHHLLYKYLYEVFDKTFIYDSYSCRLNKGTHKGVKRLEKFTRKVSMNYTRECWALKLDIKKFFASVDHQILLNLLEKKIKDKNILWLLFNIIKSFNVNHYDDMYYPMMICIIHSNLGKGIPLGNLTSQIFANIYLNELDQFIKHKLKVKYYIRYADDFIILGSDRKQVYKYTCIPEDFLRINLNLEVHPKKIILRKLNWGIDFLGYVVLPHYILPRTKTKQRIFKKLKEKLNELNFDQSLESYLGYLKHANSFKIIQNLKNEVWLVKNL